MASKGPRSRLDHETRARRQKALEAPREPQRPKTHWDHVLEEMVWLSKDFESERKWKLAQAKKVAIRASKGMLDQATRGEKRVKEEEQRLRKVALNISKDVKKFWIKIEKLVHYKHQLQIDEQKKKALDKQLEFLLGQTERYSNMLAENLVSSSSQSHCKQLNLCSEQAKRENLRLESEGGRDNVRKAAEHDGETKADSNDIDEDYDLRSEEETEDDEHTLEQDEALITKEEREEELAALQNEIDLPLEELLKRYTSQKVSRESTPEEIVDAPTPLKANGVQNDCNIAREVNAGSLSEISVRRCAESNGFLSVSDDCNIVTQGLNIIKPEDNFIESEKLVQDVFDEEQDDDDFILDTGEEKESNLDDETTLLEEEELAKAESHDASDELALLQKESEIPIEELLARYKKDNVVDEDMDTESESTYASASEDFNDSPGRKEADLNHVDSPSTRDEELTDVHAASGSHLEEVNGKSLVRSVDEKDSENIIADAAAAARSAQPTGNTFSTTKVRTKFPFLLKFPLREYQHIGLDWLVTMYEKKLNGILADEMGLGKTIMTIALLAHLACEKGIWGPHLIVVPTSVMLNWETEFLKWCPAFKILTYFGSAKERKTKRQGWLKPNSFHVCITTYRLVIQDSKVFKRKKWKYLILDEAHLIKNWKSQRWQTLLNFNSKRRILLTGTPLQNDLMELWSLMHFLMPHIFQSHQEFKDWFCNPISGMVEGQEKVNKEVVDRLHNVLRPFILRRLKRDVEKQLPMKHEHVITCRLSRRQRNLYEDFIASSETQATLASSNFFGMISVIMQLRKVCNHPDLFEGRPIVSSFDMSGIEMQLNSSICKILEPWPFSAVDIGALGLLFTHLDFCMNSWEADEIQAIATPSRLIEARADIEEVGTIIKSKKRLFETNIFEEIREALLEERQRAAKERAAAIAWWNSLKCKKRPVYSTGLRDLVTIKHHVYDIHHQNCNFLPSSCPSKLADIVLLPADRFRKMVDQVESFMFAIPAARAPPPVCWCSKAGVSVFIQPTYMQRCSELLSPLLTPFRPAIVRRQVYFPDRRLIQFDCGKLQELAILLRRLKSEGHRALIFTQMTKMLDILEAFINLYGYTYMRLDGSTQPEERQTLMQRFNTNPKIFLFILSTRSGGVGINLVGADTVIFYDSDWNPAMDQQAQDRCHRIGQTREVHIYRLISESTIEENILKKANQKRALDDLVIQSGGYNTEFLKKLDPMELFSGHRTIPLKNVEKEKHCSNAAEVPLSNADVEAALKYAEDEADYMALKKVEEEEAVDNQEFTEEAVGRLEDDDFANECDAKVDEPADNCGVITTLKNENVLMLDVAKADEDEALTLASKEDDVDMLADVKQMAAAAAAAGQAVLSFENQLRPIDRYAIRFLEQWDPIVDKTAVETQVHFEETEWELDRIEKLKEDMEAEIDDDEEPLIYERWDADFATEVYRQQVEALAQHQLMEEQECEAREKELAEHENSEPLRNNASLPRKRKSKQKPKKAKFKSLKRGALASELKVLKEESSEEMMSIDDEKICDGVTSSTEFVSQHSANGKKRKPTPENDLEKGKKKSKKLSKAPEMCSSVLASRSGKPLDETKDSRILDNGVAAEHKTLNRSKTGGKISITPMPVKRFLTLKADKLRRKGNMSSGDLLPPPDPWRSSEDAVLCAAVHEYGPQWNFVSDILHGITAGGRYRGRYRHPTHCCERFMELMQIHVLSGSDATNNAKAGNAASGKGPMRVTEDNLQLLLKIAAAQPDNEFLIETHHFSLLSAVWNLPQKLPKSGGDSFPQYSMRRPSQQRRFTNLIQCSKLVAAALSDDMSTLKDDRVPASSQNEEIVAVEEQLKITLEPQGEAESDAFALPSVINISICAPEPPTSINVSVGKDHYVKSSVEDRFRAASGLSSEICLNFASLTSSKDDIRSRATPKSQVLGKHKLPISDSTRSSKSKLKKTVVEPNDTQFPAETDLHAKYTSPSDFHAKLDSVSPCLAEVNLHNFDVSSLFDMSGELDLGTENSELVPHNYMSGLTSGLEDFSELPELTDIG